MARTIKEITAITEGAYVAQRTALGLTADDPATWSKVGRKRLWITVFVYCSWLLEQIFDTCKANVDKKIKEERAPVISWYVKQFKAYQHGFPLIAETDQFDNTGYTNAQIEASFVIKYAAGVVVGTPTGEEKVRFKLAGSTGTDLRQLTSAELAGATAYYNRFAPPGINHTIESLAPDKIKQVWKIYYDPLVLDQNGARLDGTDNTPVQTAIKSYLESMDYSGTYYTAKHVDEVQKVPGVIVPHLQTCMVAYGSLPFQTIAVMHNPDAGYLRFENDTDLEIEFIPHAQ